MKFRFKIQQYQSDAVDSTVRVFEGQPKVEGLTYRRDLGDVQDITAIIYQLSLCQTIQ